MQASDYTEFTTAVWDYYRTNGRHELPWRIPESDGTFDPYKILVSELMLQQTQVPRVIPKFYEFLTLFPDMQSLANAPLGKVLTAWSGLGYNRRAKYLHQAAQLVVSDYDAIIPQTQAELVCLPGVGTNTAGAIMAYAFDLPVLFIETNIRTVYIHHFFKDQTAIRDEDIIELLRQTLDMASPRAFYWALMDYGAYLKQSIGNLNKLSNSYSKQSKFEGSLRQIRGRVLRSLTQASLDHDALHEAIGDDRLDVVLADLVKEGLIEEVAGSYCLAGNVLQ
jgi:A/G-specific adenine glycosylase